MSEPWIEDITKNIIMKIEKIVDVWKIIGVVNEKLITRSNEMKEHVYKLLDDMLDEETQHKFELERSVEHLKEEYISLCTILMTTVDIPTEISIIKSEQQLLLKKNELLLIKKSRVDRYRALIEMEKKFCERLFEYRDELDFNAVPSEENLDKLQKRIESLSVLQDIRKRIFLSKRTEVIDIFSILGKPIPKDASVEIIFNDQYGERVPLSEDFLKHCDILINQLVNECERNIEECNSLRNRYELLHKILFPDKCESDIVEHAKKDSNDFCCNTLEKLKSDVSILEKCRKDKMKDFIINYQAQIKDKMDLLLLSHLQRKEPYVHLLNSTDYNDDGLLDDLEKKIEKFTELQGHISPILKEINNWNSCFTKLSELKLKLKDSTVLKNRGGILLKVEKEKNAVQKELPKSEARIDALLASLNNNGIVGDDLIIDDMKVLDHLLYRWNHVDGEKENDRKMAPKSDSNKSTSTKNVSTKSVIVPKKAPFSKVNNVAQSCSVPIKAAFKIPTLKKVAAKKTSISPIKKTVRPLIQGLDRRISRSCTNLSATPDKTDCLFTASNANLYGKFCASIEPGVATSSFREEFRDPK